MKKLPLLLVLLLSVSVYGKDRHQGPGPFWYSITEKILTGTQQLISPDETPSPCKGTKKPKEVKPEKAPLKCQPKQEKIMMPLSLFNFRIDEIWNDN